jgi:hypothetical protein
MGSSIHRSLFFGKIWKIDRSLSNNLADAINLEHSRERKPLWTHA